MFSKYFSPGDLTQLAIRLLIAACIVSTGFGLFRLYVYSWPMYSHNFKSASEAPLGDIPRAIYYQGLSFYQAEDYKKAKLSLENAYKELTRDTGIVPEGEEMLASDIQQLLGVVNENLEDFRLAVAAYEEALRHDSTRMPSKYNLERLKSKFPDIGNSGSSNDPKDPSNGAGRSNKKGI